MKKQITTEQIIEYFEDMAKESWSRHGRPAPTPCNLSAFVEGAACLELASILNDGNVAIENFRRRLK